MNVYAYNLSTDNSCRLGEKYELPSNEESDSLRLEI
jgi:hypothetical protein